MNSFCQPQSRPTRLVRSRCVARSAGRRVVVIYRLEFQLAWLALFVFVVGNSSALAWEVAPATVMSALPSSETLSDEPPVASASPASSAEPSDLSSGASLETPQPWDFSPYQVLLWISSSDSRLDVPAIRESLQLYLDRDFRSVWRATIAPAPAAVATSARRGLASLDFESLTAFDPVIAVKRDHADAIRIRFAANVAQYVGEIFVTESAMRDVTRRAEAIGNPTLDGVRDRLSMIEGDALALRDRWANPETEAVLVSRGMAVTLNDPEAKLIPVAMSDLASQVVDRFDKVFIIHVQQDELPYRVAAVEFDTLMRFFGPVSEASAARESDLVPAIGRAVTAAFAPTVRIEDAGQTSAKGLLRAGGLIVDPDSPASVAVGDVLVPMTRKDDRNGNPILIGPIDWAYLLVKEVDGVKSQMDYHSGRPGGLQGRQNNRTFRTALKVRPPGQQTMLRLHARDNENFPLIGYEIHERELDSSTMTFIGRTDWNGRLLVNRTDDPLRLFYVKNGGAVLARLPIVPGLTDNQVADLGSDDMRLQAEAYIRGVQNAIIDLVAIRELFAARIRLRLEKGEMKEAERLLNSLREQPTNEKLANDMGRKETEFLRLIGPRDPNQYRKVENLFSSTREMLAKHINPKIINDLEADLLAAERNDGKLVKPSVDEDVIVSRPDDQDNSKAPAKKSNSKQPNKKKT